MHQNTPNYNSKAHFGLLGLPGGALILQYWNCTGSAKTELQNWSLLCPASLFGDSS